MKKLLILAAVGGVLAATAPAHAGGFSFKISNGQGGGIVFSNGQVHHYNANQHSGWHKTDFYHQARKGQQSQPRQGFNYIPKTVNLIERRTGSTVTDIVFRNGVYHVQGFGPRGRFNQAKADPYTGRLFDVGPANPHEVPNRQVIGINKMLAGLRNQGFSRFDRVDLKGNVYKVRGLNNRGKAKLITVNSRNGHIKNVRNAQRYNLASAQPQRKAFNTFRGGLQNQKYSHFSNAQYHAGDNDWTDHYQVNARHNNRPVDLRVCAYTGSVLGYRYL